MTPTSQLAIKCARTMASLVYPHLFDGLAALGTAGGRAAAAALDGSGDRKKGQSRENEGASEDHCDVGDECEGECECGCVVGRAECST